MHQEVDVLREALVPVLDHREAARDREADPGAAEQPSHTSERLVRGADGNLPDPGSLEQVAIGPERRSTHAPP